MTEWSGVLTLILTTPGWRGSGVSFAKLASGLSARGIPTQLIAGHPETAERFATTGVPVHLVPTGDTGWREVTAVSRLLRATSSRTILCDSPRDVRIARYASVLRRRRIIWRYNLHSRALGNDPLQHWLFRGLSRIVHISEYSRRRLPSQLPWLTRVGEQLIPNGIDVERFRPDADDGRRFRESWGIGPRESLVVTPTPVLAEKATELATAVVGRVAASRPLTWLVPDTEIAVNSLGVSKEVRVIASGRLEGDAYRAALRAADVVLLPGAVELFGNATAEAMATGSAVLGADGGATPEIVGPAGVLFDPADAAGGAEALVRLLDDPTERNRLGGMARQRIVDSFALEQMIDAYAALIGGR